MSKAARNFSSCLREVYHRHESFELVRNGIPYARLVPIGERPGNTHDLADALGSAMLHPEDGRGWTASVTEGRKRLKLLKNPWG